MLGAIALIRKLSFEYVAAAAPPAKLNMLGGSIVISGGKFIIK